MIPKSYPSSPLNLLAGLVPLVVGTQGAAKRIIVDDANTRIMYSSNGWATETTCPACFPQLDKTQLRDNTWHFSNNTANSGFTFFFIGTSVELRHVASDTIQLLPERVSYVIDGVQYGIAAQPQRLNATSFAYNQSLFNVTGLPNTEHTLQVTVVQSSSVFLDYLIYEEMDNITTSSQTSRPSSTPEVSPSNPGSRTSNPNLGAIIGGTVAGVALVVLGIVFFLFLRRRSCVRLSETVALYQSVGVTTPEPRNITGGPKGHSFNTVNTVPNQVQAPLPDQPVEAGLMSSPMCSNFPSEGSRSRRTLMFG